MEQSKAETGLFHGKHQDTWHSDGMDIYIYIEIVNMMIDQWMTLFLMVSIWQDDDGVFSFVIFLSHTCFRSFFLFPHLLRLAGAMIWISLKLVFLSSPNGNFNRDYNNDSKTNQ